MATQRSTKRRSKRTKRPRNQDGQMTSYQPRAGSSYRKPTPNVYKFKRWCNPNLALETGADASQTRDGAVSFSFSNVANISDLRELFGQYQITGVRYRWTLTRNPDLATTSTLRGNYPYVTWCIDNDDTATPNTATIRQYQTAQTFQFTDSTATSPWYYFRPSTLKMIYDGLTTAYSPEWGQWIASSYPSVPHYGIKYNAGPLPTGLSMSMEAILYLKMRQVL